MEKNRSKVTNWATIFQDVTNNPKSGENGEQMLQRAHDLYEGKHGEKFKFVGCYEVLRESPKFATNLGNKEDEDTAFSNVGATIQRPTGQKIAKKREKEIGDAAYRSNKRVHALCIENRAMRRKQGSFSKKCWPIETSIAIVRNNHNKHLQRG